MLENRILHSTGSPESGYDWNHTFVLELIVPHVGMGATRDLSSI